MHPKVVRARHVTRQLSGRLGDVRSALQGEVDHLRHQCWETANALEVIRAERREAAQALAALRRERGDAAESLQALRSELRRETRPMVTQHFIVIPRWKLCYARVPKVANTSIKTMLAENLGLDHSRLKPTNDGFWRNRRDLGIDLISSEEFILSYQGYFSFAFVREPRDRLLSFYSANIRKWSLRDRMKELGFRKDMSVSEFIRRACEIPDDEADIHFASQSSILTFRGQVVPTFIGRFENLAEDWGRLRQLLLGLRGLTLQDLGISNRVEKANADRDAMFDPELSKLVFKRYEADYDLFFEGIRR